MNDHQKSGRFGPGNKAARGRKNRKRTTLQLIEIVQSKLAELGEERTLDDFIAQSVCRLIMAAGKGDLKAAVWIVDRFYPSEREPMIQVGKLPSPSQKPLEFLDALATAVGQGKLSTDQAARLAHLSRPLIIDDVFRDLAEQFEKLSAQVKSIEHQRLRAVT